MSIITFNSALRVSKMRWERADQDVLFRGPFGVQAMNVAAPLWKVNVNFDLLDEKESGPYQSLGMQLSGARNTLELWNLGRPVPLGTMRGSPTLTASANPGATSLSITNAGQAGTTLKAGDYLGVGTSYTQQVIMVLTDITLDGSGSATISTSPAIRFTQASGAVVVWYQPKALFRQQTVSNGWDYERTTASGLSLDLLEDWRQ
jgi:hypothetical protein